MSNNQNTTKIITNEEILSVYNDIDNKKIMGKAAVPFVTILTPDEIESCKKKAIWRSLINYDPTMNTKYATYLYRGVFLECRSSASFVMKHRKRSVKSKNKVNEVRIFEVDKLGSDFTVKETLPMVDRIALMDEINSLEDGDILIDFYLNGLSYDEIAVKNNIDKSEVTQRKSKVLRKLKKKFCN
jgi:DNA-directed RNA polymerase specialized sigma24 family protein